MTDLVLPPTSLFETIPADFTIYEIATGRPRLIYAGGEPEAQCRTGEAFLPGRYPHPRYVIDHATRTAARVDPVAKPGKRWSDEAGSFVATDEQLVKEAARARIGELEKQQARAIREERIGRGGTPTELKARLEQIDDEIVALRETINS